MVAVDPEAARSLARYLDAVGINLYNASFSSSPDTGALHYETSSALRDLDQNCRDLGTSIQELEDTLLAFVDYLILVDGHAADSLPKWPGPPCTIPPYPNLNPAAPHDSCDPPPTLPLAPGRKPVPPPEPTELPSFDLPSSS